MKFCRAIFPIAALVFDGCATNPPPALLLSPERAATQFDARSLPDAGLRRFLTENSGGEPGSWDFETLSWVAFYYHPSLALARAQWATTRATQQTVGARPNPTVSLTPGYNSTRSPGVSPRFPAINFDFLLPTSGKRARQQEIARADAEAARFAVLVAAWQVRGELRAALTEVAVAARREASLRALAGVQRELLALLEKRFDSGFASSTEILLVRLATLRAESAAADAASQQLIARTRTATALGLPLAALAGIPLPPPLAGVAFSSEAFATARRLSLHSRADGPPRANAVLKFFFQC